MIRYTPCLPSFQSASSGSAVRRRDSVPRSLQTGRHEKNAVPLRPGRAQVLFDHHGIAHRHASQKVAALATHRPATSRRPSARPSWSKATSGMCSICVSIAQPKMMVCMTGTTSMKNSVDRWRRICANSFTIMGTNPSVVRPTLRGLRRGADGNAVPA